MMPPFHFFSFGPFMITAYGLLIALGSLLGILLARHRAHVYGIAKETLDDFFPGVMLAILVGARLYHVLDKWSYYQEHIFQILAIWHGGLAIYGGLVAGIAYTIWFARKRRFGSWMAFLDLLAPSALVAQTIGRWGNFFNQEAFGPPTNLAWKIYIEPEHRPPQWSNDSYFHPLFLYESLWNLVGFAILYKLGPKLTNRSGSILGLYCIWYGIGRLLIEPLRFDTATIGGVKLASLLSFLFIFVGVYCLIRTTKPTMSLIDQG